MKIKLNTLILLSVLAAVGVITLQVTWLKTSYQISREKIKIVASAKLRQAIEMHEESVAKNIRSILIKAIKANPNFYIKLISRHEGFQVGYHGPHGIMNRIGPLFDLTKEEGVEARKDAYYFFLQRISRANLEELKYVFDNTLGSYVDLDNMDNQIFKAFEFRRDTATLNKFLRNIDAKESTRVNYKANYYEDILDVLGSTGDEYADNDGVSADSTMIWVEPSYYKLVMGEKLDSLETFLQRKNGIGDSIYVAQPLFVKDNVLNNLSPVILLTCDAPVAYVLNQMLFSLIGSVLLFVLLGFCLIYMVKTILKQKKLSEIKDDFISNVSHELKTPVATTLAAIQGMQHFDVLKDEEKTEQYLGTAEKEMKRLSTMIDTILNSAIYERSDFNLHLAKFNLKELLMEMIGIQESHAKKEVKIELNYLATEEVLADKTHLYNVFINLVDNAIKYGKEKVNIKISCIDSDGGIKIQITDNGNGIPIAYQRNIFDKFFRVPSPADHSIKGYGLGLNYVKNIIEKLKGTINLLKSDANGSTFEINLPQ